MTNKNLRIPLELLIFFQCGAEVQVRAFARNLMNAYHRVLKQFWMFSETGDPFSKFLGDCVTVLIALFPVQDSDSC